MDFLPFLIAGLGTGAAYATSGVGLVVLYRATGVLNFSFGAVGAVGAFCCWSLINQHYPPELGWAAGVAVSVAASLLYGYGLAPRLAGRDTVVRAVGTLGFALILLGVMGAVWGEGPKRLSLPTDRLYIEIFDVRLTYTRLLALMLAAAMVAGVGLLLARTRIGLAMRALADDREHSALLGVAVGRVEAVAWGLSGLFAGICGILLADMVRLQGLQLTFLVIPAIAAAILGRLSSLEATALAGLGIGLVESLLSNVGEVAPFRTAVPFAIALLAIAVFSRSFAKAES